MITIDSSGIVTYTREFQNTAKRLNTQGDKIFRVFCLNIFDDVTSRSPRDKGMYAADWQFEKGGQGTYKIINSMPYAGVMETGSDPGGRPWPSAGPKTVVANGKIWSNQMPEPVAGGAVEAADWEGLRAELANLVQ